MSRPWMWRWAVTSLHLGVILLPTNRSVGAPTPHLFAAPARASLAAATPAGRHEVVVLLRADSPLVVGAAGKLSSSHPGLAGILTRHGFAQAARLDRGATSSGPGDRGGGYYRLTSLRTDCDPVQAAAELRATGLFRAVVANTSVRLFASRPSHGELQKHRTAPRPAASLPDDPYLLLQWHIDSGDAADVALPEAWDLERGNPGVVIAIMDTGVDTGHPDLAGALWANPGEVAGNGRDDDGNGFADDIHGWDFGGDDADPRPHATPDVSGLDVGFHGTHTAGIASAATDNGIGIAGAGWDCGLMALKVTDPSGAITDAAIAAAFAYAGDMGAAVLSMSFGADGAPGVPEFFQALVDDATAAGVLCVAAAGNDSTDATVYPAANDHVLAVGATDETNGRAFFSNYGAWVDVAAPGTLIFSSICDNYEFDLISQLFYLLFFGWDGVNPYMVSDGTSMACPPDGGSVRSGARRGAQPEPRRGGPARRQHRRCPALRPPHRHEAERAPRRASGTGGERRLGPAGAGPPRRRPQPVQPRDHGALRRPRRRRVPRDLRWRRQIGAPARGRAPRRGGARRALGRQGRRRPRRRERRVLRPARGRWGALDA